MRVRTLAAQDYVGDSQIGRFRKVLVKAGVNNMGAVKPNESEHVIVDTTVQGKAAAHPSDSRLLEVARAKIAQLATREGIKLRQSYAAKGRQLRRRGDGYAHARRFKRLHRALRR